MEKIKPAVFDAGPLIHLHEVQKLSFVKIFKAFSTKEIFEECVGMEDVLKPILVLKELRAVNKDFSKYLLERYDLDLGEATGIALCKQERIALFFTDDLDARKTARILGFNAYGTLAIILRAYKERIVKREEAETLLRVLYNESSLFFTKDLFEWTLGEIEKFNYTAKK